MLGLLIALMVLLNVGGVIAVVIGIGQGGAGWLGTLVALMLMDGAGFYILRLLRD